MVETCSTAADGEEVREEEDHATRCSGDGRYPRHWGGDLPRLSRRPATRWPLTTPETMRRPQKFKADTGIPVYKWDVSSYEACAEGVKKVVADLGHVEVLVNNAGITRDSTLHRMKPEQWAAVINTNLNSLFNMCRQVIEGMRERKFGRIINISSINGQKGQIGQTNYSAAKAGEIGFTKALAQENARLGHHRQRDRPRLYQHRDGAGGPARTCWRRSSRRSRSAGWANPTTWRAACCFSRPTAPTSLLARRSR